MFLIIVLYLNNECATFWQWQLLKPWQQKRSHCLPFSKPCHSLQAGETQLKPSGGTTISFVIQLSVFFYLSLLLLRNKKRLFVQINVSWTSMQVPPLGLSYLLIISWSLVIQKLPIQLKKRQINLELHLSVSKRERKLNTTNTLNDRKASGFFCRTHILNFLSFE